MIESCIQHILNLLHFRHIYFIAYTENAVYSIILVNRKEKRQTLDFFYEHQLLSIVGNNA